MKKILITSLLILSLITLVFAQVGPADGTGPEHDTMIAAGGQNGILLLEKELELKSWLEIILEKVDNKCKFKQWLIIEFN